ncbi:MAG TPA: hypothetical protein VEP48_05005 [Methylomirabilota bacterium]|nr:hypothetical protein [Methylomirabilota bacterium]
MHRHLARTLAFIAISTLLATSAYAASPTPPALPVIEEAGSPQFTSIGGAAPLATDKTVPHWHGQFTDPTNGVTYGYNMVGLEDPRNAGAGTTTIPVDIIPLRLEFTAEGGYALDGANAVSLTMASPVFQDADYTSTAFSSGGAGPLSAGNVGVQYEDAIMRSQFNKTGTAYHLKFAAPTVFDAVTLKVPKGKGDAVINRRGVILGLADINWFSTNVQSLMGSLHTDPTHLPIFLTDNVMLYIGSPAICCVIGYHGAAKATGLGYGPTNGNGNQGVQTFAFAAYSRPGTFNPASSHFVTDIHALSHEIAEWGDDPFVNNTVNPWLTPTAPQYGCSGFLETGDPVVGIGFHLPNNPDTRPYSDGSWHPEDEVFLPWFARETPNHTSQLTQSGTGGRYTFMGDLNPYPGFRQAATGC